MNWNFTLSFTAAAFAMALLASCELPDSGGSGETIRNPTVDDMARLESQWGMTPRAVKPRFREAGPADFINPSGTPIVPSTSALAQPAPEVAPLPPTTVLPAQPATVDPATLQKLKN